MNCTASRLPYRNTGYFSPLILDYLEAKDSLRPFYTHHPSAEGIRAAIGCRRKFDTNRAVLVQTLREQYQKRFLTASRNRKHRSTGGG